MSHSHDQNYKNLILDYPRQAIQFFAAEEADQVDDSVEIIPLRQEQLKERLGDRFRELDTPLLLQWPDGRREAIVFILEEESDPARFHIERLAHYCLDIASLLETKRVVPVVIFLRKGQYPLSLTLGSEKGAFLTFHYIACELWKLSAEDFWESQNIVARLNLPLMQHSQAQHVATYAKSVDGLVILEHRIEYQRKYIDFIDKYANLDENEIAHYWTDYVSRNEAGERVMGAFQKKFEEMRAEGRVEGRVEEARKSVMLVLEARFGQVTDDIKTAITSMADPLVLEQKLQQAIICTSLDEFKMQLG